MKEKNRILNSVWYLCVFVFLFAWFSYIYPLVLFDGDDWTHIVYERSALPEWGGWNPARVFPEIFFPFCGNVAALLIKPLTGDYLQAVTIVSAFVVSAFIVVYVHCFAQLIKRLFSLSQFPVILISSLFLILHFLVLRNAQSDNYYLFHCYDLTCYFFYLLPALINASLVMVMIQNSGFEKFLSDGNPALKGLLYLVIYLAIFSNLAVSIILAVYAGSRVLTGFFRRKKDGLSFGRYLRANILFILILILWLISFVYELSGGRANSDMGQPDSFFQAIILSLSSLVAVFSKCNDLFYVFTAGVGIAFVVSLISSCRKQEDNTALYTHMTVLIVCVFAMVACLIVLCSKVNVLNISRSEYLFGLFFFLFLTILSALAYVIKRHQKILVVVPFVLCVLFSEVNTFGKTFKSSCDMDVAIRTNISRDLIEQIVEADQAGLTEMMLYVPEFDSGDNWPLPVYMAEEIANTLYEHNIVSSAIQITVVPSIEKNELYHLPYSKHE